MAKTYKKLDAPAIIYEFNPSIKEVNLATRKRKNFINGSKAMIVTDLTTGEQMPAGVTFVDQKEVDTEQFIKLYTLGVDELMNLSGAGLKVFKIIYYMMLESPNSDRVTLDLNALIHRKIWTWSQPTFNTGVNELLVKTVIFKALESAQYFINLKFFFNGDRINIVKSYKLKQTDIFDEQKFLN